MAGQPIDTAAGPTFHCLKKRTWKLHEPQSVILRVQKKHGGGQKTCWRSQTKSQQASISPGGSRAFVSSESGSSGYTCMPAHTCANVLV